MKLFPLILISFPGLQLFHLSRVRIDIYGLFSASLLRYRSKAFGGSALLSCPTERGQPMQHTYVVTSSICVMLMGIRRSQNPSSPVNRGSS